MPANDRAVILHRLADLVDKYREPLAQLESLDVGKPLGQSHCQVEHVGMVVSGCATAAMADGTIHEMRAGEIFYIPPGPPGHDSWVIGDEPYVSLHFLGAGEYAAGHKD